MAASQDSSARDFAARRVPLGGVRGTSVWRTLPHRKLSTIGAWCFFDEFDGLDPQGSGAMVVRPHPHTGLQTVTWPLSGAVHHRDSLQHDAMVRPGELNLMTSGRGIAHSEISDNSAGELRGLQFWIALPSPASRWYRQEIAPSFEQYADLPQVQLAPEVTGKVILGSFNGATSPATVHTPLVGVEITAHALSQVDRPLNTLFEHGLYLLDGSASSNAADLPVKVLRYYPAGRSRIQLELSAGARLFLLGGEPFDERLVMWWNFIGRTHEEVVQARDAWEDPTERANRYGVVPGDYSPERIPAPPLPPVRLRSR